MKYCPACQSQYTDDTLRFCLQDGTPLRDPFSAPRTGAFGEQETVVSNRPSGQYGVPRETQPTNWQPPGNVPAKSNTPNAIFLTVFLMLVFFSLIGLGLWFYFNGLSGDKNANLILANKAENDNSLRASSSPRVQATRMPTTLTTPATETSANTNTAVPDAVNREQIKTDVSGRINTWKAQAESRDLDAYMNNYAGTVDYYRKRGASHAAVRSDKQRAFNKYNSIRINLTNLTVTPGPDGDRATAVFDKEWEFSSPEDVSRGKVRTQLQLKKMSGQWLITGERDVKVYYVE